MFKIRTVIMFVVALTLVIVLVAAANFKMATTATAQSLPVANAVSKSDNLAPASDNPSPVYGTNMSTQTIRNILDQAYEHYRIGPREEQLQRILNGRYENRVNLPR